MALERFMLYAEHGSCGCVEAVYCWGFRASLRVARKMAAWTVPVAAVDLDTLTETRWFGEAHAARYRGYRPEGADPPIAGFIVRRPEPLKVRLGSVPADLLRAEVDLHGGLTAWSPVGQFWGEGRPSFRGSSP